MPSELYYPSGVSSLNPDIVKYASVVNPSNLIIWTPVSGKSIVLYGMQITMLSGTANNNILVMRVNTVFMKFLTSTITPQINEFQNGLRIFGVNETIKLDASLASTMSYTLWGTEI